MTDSLDAIGAIGKRIRRERVISLVISACPKMQILRDNVSR